MISLLSPGKAPLDLAGASRIHIVVRSPYSRTTKLTFPCSRDKLPGHANSNLSKAFEIALRLAFSFRRSVLRHGNNHDRRNAEDVKNRSGEIRNV